jgi:DNA repair exonuclease SbcCD nuclease subunit
MAIKKIIHCSDIHINNILRHEEYAEQLTQFIEKCQEIAANYDKDEIRIVIAGDLLHSKNNISPELITFVSTFIRQLEEISKVIVIAGNHDLIVNNSSRKDAISSIFETANFTNSYLLDMELAYESGYVIDDNITWCLYSIFDNFKQPNIQEAKELYPSNINVGLYHGMIVGSMLYNGSIVDCGVNGTLFEDCDCVMAGDIHKFQLIKRNDIDIIYPSSLIQQNYGETVTQHGFCVWDVESMTHEFVPLVSDYGMYKFEISNIDDIDNDKEILINY